MSSLHKYGNVIPRLRVSFVYLFRDPIRLLIIVIIDTHVHSLEILLATIRDGFLLLTGVFI